MPQNKKKKHNQVSENIYCNSEEYNGIFDSGIWFSEIQRMKPPIDAFLNNELAFLSHFLKIGMGSTNSSYTQDGEIDRRDLKVSVKLPKKSKNPLQLLSVDYTYVFDLYMPSATYLRGVEYQIHSKWCKCTAFSSNQIYTFEVIAPISLFHFSFHAPNAAKPPEEKRVGAFHVRVDIIDPQLFRAFIPHPVGASTAYYHFHDLDSSMNGYYTNRHPDPPVHELGNYLSQPMHHEHKKQMRQVDEHNLVSLVVAPIYDMLVDQILNPLIQRRLPADTVIPVPSPYNPTQPVKSCTDMKANPDPKPPYFGGKKNSRRILQSRRALRAILRKTSKNRSILISMG